jgi:nitroimidazol reductase NimA-like FMN-containing flavoprotein (pyridoxamine 5'-phosphate oxidase superfamily)
MSPVVPKRSRPHIKDYGIPEDDAGMLEWSFVTERMKSALNYWVCTVFPDARPHVVAVWGAWIDDRLYFGGGPDTRWARNLRANPQVAVHLESGHEAVIFEGTAEFVTITDAVLQKQLDETYKSKYDLESHGNTYWILKPRKAFAWKEFPTTPTRWIFE